ncbi:GPW/gp25 family protein [uncultured Hoeflea sp.]|uniref:GPW/gp25 family protein n=1 Tax=uncultured Hoeflea sp. TaxID=538666 RepID=UPI0030DBFA25|tara:strand:+ start:1584 stop:1979 length:396 start_codon:yes stop_codon:yes gene_type:complete
MAGIDRRTGKGLSNYDHALQSVEVILSTRIGSRVMRRQFGGGVAEILGRAVTPPLFALFQQLVATAIDTWEPRFQVRKITPLGTVEQIRAGQVGMRFDVDFRPRGHLGDFTVERVLTFGLNFRAGGLRVIS